ncbi:Autophagy-related protein 16 [Frankliniella fusca]|uniref:Autophagy-related protein 16 n=1 Tax=Frankliniella fusca TaxID=407009 RepID=A0AAE1GYG9_9NEOP|nr:Autophagy-related protein 16 [Frankliniella fusca]
MTCRSHSCSYAVPQLHRKCKSCNKIQKRFSSRAVLKTAFSPSKPKTPNKYKPYQSLITPEKKKRVELYQKQIKNLRRDKSRLEELIVKKVAEESVLVDEDFDKDLTSWIQEADQDNKVLDFHKIFLQQQLQASNLKDKRGMRWHPLMIRFALLVKSISDSAYSAMAQSGFIHLPYQTTLYDYAHAMDIHEGCHPDIIEDVAKVVNACKHPYQKHHVLSFDVVTVSQNLVTRKDSGEVIGYCKLDAVKSDILELEKN